MSKSKDIQVAKILLEHKDFGLMCLLKDLLKNESYYSDLGLFPFGENILYLSFFFKEKGCGNTIYKLNINLESYSSDICPLFLVGFEKNNHDEFGEEEKAKFNKIKNEVTKRIPSKDYPNDSEKTIPLGVFAASNLTELVNDILKNYDFKKTDDDLADVSDGKFFTLAKIKEIVSAYFNKRH